MGDLVRFTLKCGLGSPFLVSEIFHLEKIFSEQGVESGPRSPWGFHKITILASIFVTRVLAYYLLRLVFSLQLGRVLILFA
jgi:hypothetical protein